MDYSFEDIFWIYFKKVIIQSLFWNVNLFVKGKYCIEVFNVVFEFVSNFLCRSAVNLITLVVVDGIVKRIGVCFDIAVA